MKESAKKVKSSNISKASKALSKPKIRSVSALRKHIRNGMISVGSSLLSPQSGIESKNRLLDDSSGTIESKMGGTGENKSSKSESEGMQIRNKNHPSRHVGEKTSLKKKEQGHVDARVDRKTNLEDSIKEKETANYGNSNGRLCNERTIYIEGLPYSASEEDIRKFFAKIISTSSGVQGSIEDIRLPVWHDSGRLRGYGHVVFSSAKLADKALGLDGSYMGERYIKVSKPLVPRIEQSMEALTSTKVIRPAGCRSIFVKNLPYETSEEEISEALKVCGPITAIRLPKWGHTNQLKGIAYVDFKREDSAEIAVKKSMKITIKSRPLVIDFETGAPKRSFKASSDTKAKPVE